MILDLLLGGLGYMAFLALQKAVLEPIASRAGNAVVDRLMPVAVDLLDIYVEAGHLSFDPDQVVRDFIHKEETGLSEKQIDSIVEEVFRRWDLRVCIKNRNATGANSFKF